MQSSSPTLRATRFQTPIHYKAAAQSFGLWLAFLLLSILVFALVPRQAGGF